MQQYARRNTGKGWFYRNGANIPIYSDILNLITTLKNGKTRYRNKCSDSAPYFLFMSWLFIPFRLIPQLSATANHTKYFPLRSTTIYSSTYPEYLKIEAVWFGQHDRTDNFHPLTLSIIRYQTKEPAVYNCRLFIVNVQYELFFVLFIRVKYGVYIPIVCTHSIKGIEIQHRSVTPKRFSKYRTVLGIVSKVTSHT